jgi:KUP system potassium uptake protein
MTELVPGEVVHDDLSTSAATRNRPLRPRTRRRALVLGALGVVYGDIGTSPLYAVQSVFGINGGAVQPTPGDVFGVVSLIFWSITLVVSVKYVTFVLRADNDGEGGVIALAALARRALSGSTSRIAALVMVLGALGAALFYGDSVITPAISVLSAVEGLEVAAPGLAGAAVPVAVVVLTALFLVQRWGTERVGRVFGPVMLLWFAALGAAGLGQVIHRPGILLGLSPTYAVGFVAERPYVAFLAMGAVVLAITGAEALYSDLGHFGRSPIRWAWFVVVFPALTLNYLAQGALILRDPSARTNPFFLLLPGWAGIPMVVLAALATVIASQAVISGAFSLSRQAARLGFLPRLRIRHTSAHQSGQIYVPAINWVLLAGVLAVTLGFRSSARLATAYGVAVTGTFLITTALFLTVAREGWGWRTGRLTAAGVVFGGVELTFFGANLTKVVSGGWLTLTIAVTVLTVMLTWRRGRELLLARRVEMEGPLSDFVADVRAAPVLRVPGTAVYPHATKATTPIALRATVERMHVLHERVVVITGRTTDVPHIPWPQRLRTDHLGNQADGIVHISADFGFLDRTDFADVLRHAAARPPRGLEVDVDVDGAWFFVSEPVLRRTRRPGMRAWRKALFIALAHRDGTVAESLHLPPDRTVAMGTRIDI